MHDPECESLPSGDSELKETSLAVRYWELLREHRDPAKPAVCAFLQRYRGDPVLGARMRILNVMWRLRISGDSGASEMVEA